MKKPSFVSLLAILALAACGGSIGVDPITGGPGSTDTNAAGTPTANQTNEEAAPEPVAPISPYTGDVSTNDVSILFPLPAESEPHSVIVATESGKHGELLPKAFFDTVVPGGALDRTSSLHSSGYDDLAMMSLRLDHCSARKGPGTCTSEVRAVFQAIYLKTGTEPDGDPTKGLAAQDGALHVVYDIGEAELVVMMKQILTLRKKHGDKTSPVLGPYPNLAQGGFAAAQTYFGLRDIFVEHLGANRIARVTVFDHNMDPDSDGWTFAMFDRAGSTLARKKIPMLDGEMATVGGSSAFQGPLRETSAFTFTPGNTDSVEPLVMAGRPEKLELEPQAATALQQAFEAAIRVQNPTIHNAETTDCANCHLAEGAHLIGENVYAMKATTQFTAPGGTSYVLDRASVTNLHAFGYLHRKISIMQRTANESTVVRDWMDKKVK
jgi:hypothetical protein